MSPPQAPDMSDSSPRIFYHSNLRFFPSIRRLRRPKASESTPAPPPAGFEEGENVETEAEDGLVALRRSVKRLHFGSWEEKEAAAIEIRRLAKEDSKTRKALAELGVVPPLVAMVGSEVAGRRRPAVQALIELANGSYTTKALMLGAGILSKLPENVDGIDEPTMHELAQLLQSLSSLANSQFPFTSPRIPPLLAGILESSASTGTIKLCLSTVYNLSTMLDNATALASTEMIHALLKLSTEKETSENALAAVGNLAVTLPGKKAMEESPVAPESLIEILTWEEKPKCQELSAYLLMILAHQSSIQRKKMADSGIVSVLLEVALLGSPLAQKRALKLLQWFKDERQARMGPHSGPQTAGRVVEIGSPVSEREKNEGREMMKKLVKQSLYKNLETITRRANAAEDSSSSRLKALALSSSSKSLPY
ncbi:uncharacterized protein LOC127793995 [Diospyros lotus]|uniref:uncharacterized protein LOC127793995 n=1 Tax=Diospyros lotus TaxID=55363 RepID=UPI00225882A2|nr:uncharacterized protein LOC127793995 [Diospyros lotus]